MSISEGPNDEITYLRVTRGVWRQLIQGQIIEELIARPAKENHAVAKSPSNTNLCYL